MRESWNKTGMDPVIIYSGLKLSLIEIILGVALMILGALITLVFSRRGNPKLESHMATMTEQQLALQGRLAQFAEDSAQRDIMFRDSLDTRLANVTDRVGKSLMETQDRNTENLKHLHERLALIDRAQKNIETLSGEVSGLQSLLSNKQARGAFGEKQMQDLITTYMPPHAYSFQATLSNNKRVDALIHLPQNQGDVAIDSKFPMESWRRMTEAENTQDEDTAKKLFARDVLTHIKDISQKYLIFGETHDIALMFLPSEAIYAELHANFPKVIEKGFSQKVMIVSPTTFMATLHTMRAVMKDAAMREQAHIIQKEVRLISEDVRRLDERVEKLHTHFSLSVKDIDKIRTSTQKIITRSDKIENLDVAIPTPEPISNIAPQASESHSVDFELRDRRA